MAHDAPAVIDAAHLERQRAWSEATFGPGPRTLGVLDHIRKELAEIEAAPEDLSEWVDVLILAFDGAWRAGWEPQQIIDAIVAKQVANEARTWPDWRTASPDQAIEHDRSGEVHSLLDAIRRVMSDPDVTALYPLGLGATDVLREVRRRFGPDAFPLVSVLDVADELRAFYGT